MIFFVVISFSTEVTFLFFMLWKFFIKILLVIAVFAVISPLCQNHDTITAKHYRNSRLVIIDQAADSFGAQQVEIKSEIDSVCFDFCNLSAVVILAPVEEHDFPHLERKNIVIRFISEGRLQPKLGSHLA